MKDIIKTVIRSKQPEPEPVPVAERLPFVGVNYRLMRLLVESDQKAFATAREKLAKISPLYDAEMKKLDGLSHDAARREFKAMLLAALNGTGDAKAIPTGAELIRRNSNARLAVRAAAARHCHQAKLIVAELYETAILRCAEFSEGLLKQERAITPGIKLASSHLSRELDALPKFMALQISFLRSNPTVLTNPAQLLADI